MEFYFAYDLANTTCRATLYDINGNIVTDGTNSATATHATGGALGTNAGWVSVNSSYILDGSAAATWDGFAISSGSEPVATQRWQKPAVGDTGHLVGWIMGDTTSGALSTAAEMSSGTAITWTGGTGGLSDAGGWSAVASPAMDWSSSNTAVATVSPTSNSTTTVATAVATGATNIIAKLHSNNTIQGQATLRVASPASVMISPSSITLLGPSGSGNTGQLVGNVFDSLNNPLVWPVFWSSSNTGVATIDSTGLVTWVALGTATITVTVVGGTNPTNTATVTCGTAVSNEPGGYVQTINTGKINKLSTGNFTLGTGYLGATVTWTNYGDVVNTKLVSSLSPSETGWRMILPPTLAGRLRCIEH